MKKEIEDLPLHDMLSSVADIFGIIGFIITIYLAVSTNNIKGRVKLITNIEILKAEKQTLLKDLKSTLDIINMEVDSPTMYNDLHIVLRKLEEYKYSMNKEDKKNIKMFKKMLNNKSKIDKQEVNNRVAKIIGFLDLKMDDSSNIL